jgi:hypothetical protein
VGALIFRALKESEQPAMNFELLKSLRAGDAPAPADETKPSVLPKKKPERETLPEAQPLRRAA